MLVGCNQPPFTVGWRHWQPVTFAGKNGFPGCYRHHRLLLCRGTAEGRPNREQEIRLRIERQGDAAPVPVAHDVLLADAPEGSGSDADGVAARDKVQVSPLFGHLWTI